MPSNNPPHSDRRPHDLRSTLTKSKILDGARQVFLLNGYAAASIDQIINQSGVSKGAIYHHFESKDVLFNSLVAAEAERIARVLPSIDPDEPNPCSALQQIGMAMLDTLNNPATISTLRLIIGALGRFPQLGQEFLRKSLGQTVEGIAAYLNVNSASNGIQIINSYAAAEEFARRCLTPESTLTVPWRAPWRLPRRLRSRILARSYSATMP